MEGLNDNKENFEDFRNKVAGIFGSEGLSENLLSEIKRWATRRIEETDQRITVEERTADFEKRIRFEIEYAHIYIATEQYDLALETLDHAAYQASNAGLEELSKEIRRFMFENWND